MLALKYLVSNQARVRPGVGGSQVFTGAGLETPGVKSGQDQASVFVAARCSRLAQGCLLGDAWCQVRPLIAYLAQSHRR